MDISFTHQMGGMLETQRTGIYPDFLVFFSNKHRKEWRRRKRADEQKGTLKVKGKSVANFIYKQNHCSIQDIDENGIKGEWYQPVEDILMCD